MAFVEISEENIKDLLSTKDSKERNAQWKGEWNYSGITWQTKVYLQISRTSQNVN